MNWTMAISAGVGRTNCSYCYYLLLLLLLLLSTGRLGRPNHDLCTRYRHSRIRRRNERIVGHETFEWKERGQDSPVLNLFKEGGQGNDKLLPFRSPCEPVFRKPILQLHTYILSDSKPMPRRFEIPFW